MAIVALPKIKAVSTSLAALAGAKLYVYDAGTTTARTTYQDSSFATPHASPVVADANGDFAAVHIDPTGGAYKLDLQTSAGVSVSGYPVDNIPVEDLPLDASGNATFIASLKLTGDISPAQITAQQDDYAPPSFSTASVVRVSSNAARSITGLAGGAEGRVVLIFNVGSFTITLEDEHSSSTAANRFALNADLSLTADTGALLYYDATSSRWRAIGGAGGGLTDIVLDTTPQLGGNLDTNGFALTDATDSVVNVNAQLYASLATVPLRATNTVDSAVSQAAIFEGDRATPANSDFAYMSLRLSDSGGTQTEFARMGWTAVDVTDTSEDGRITWAVQVAGTLTNKLILEGSFLTPGLNAGTSLGDPGSGVGWGGLYISSGEFNLGHASDTSFTRVSAGVAAIEGNTILTNGQTATLAKGFATTPYNAGTKSSGTYTPAESDGSFQYATNNGAHTLAPPTNNTTLVIQYTNGASAGAITTSGFTEVSGESFTTTNGDDFMCFITKNNGFSTLHVRALQ